MFEEIHRVRQNISLEADTTSTKGVDGTRAIEAELIDSKFVGTDTDILCEFIVLFFTDACDFVFLKFNIKSVSLGILCGLKWT